MNARDLVVSGVHPYVAPVRVTCLGYPREAAERRFSRVVTANVRGAGSRDVVGVILAFRRALREVPSQQCPEVAAEYLCDLFDGSAAALNLMDYGHSRYQTLTNVGQLAVGERPTPDGEFYPFADFPWTTQHLARGSSYRSMLDDADCPQEYRQLLSAQRRTDCLGAPIRMAGRPVGEFWVARNTGRPFSEADEDLAVACGATLARFFRPSWAVAG